mmetsp:Transcript_19032/g.38422  ORF Transcript_19032/g.38422 Transcript_19032/m.38422 type:complete len:140 (+) Transcript_19032:1-420(+)
MKLKVTSSEAELENFYAGVKTLTAVPGVLSVSIEPIDNNVYVGYDDRTKGYTHALMVILKDKKALEFYDKNSYHATIKSTIIKPMLAAVSDPVMAVDWEGDAPKLKSCCFSGLTSFKSLSILTAAAVVIVGAVVMRSRL